MESFVRHALQSRDCRLENEPETRQVQEQPAQNALGLEFGNGSASSRRPVMLAPEG